MKCCLVTNVPLYSTVEIKSYRFGKTWGWVNDDRIKLDHTIYNHKITHFMEYNFRCTDVKDNVWQHAALKTECSSIDQMRSFRPLAQRNYFTYGLAWYFKRCFKARAQMWYYMHMNYGASSRPSWCDDVDACVRVCPAEGVFPRRTLEKGGGDWSGGRERWL